MRTILGVAMCLLLGAFTAGCGTSGGCGTGTYKDGKKCRPGEPGAPLVSVDPPAGRTREVSVVRLSTNEPATIYYTTDGTEPTTTSANEPDLVVLHGLDEFDTVRYFAVDAEGNQSAVEAATWTLDIAGPMVPSLDLALSGSQRTVTWTRPTQSDLVGVVVARVVGRLAGPAPESAPIVGDEIAPGVQVVAVSEGEGSFTEDLPAEPGLVRYAAWGVDDLGNYGPAASDYEVVPIPPQTLTLTADAASGVVAVTSAPGVHSISGTATYDSVASELSVELTITNGSTRVLFAPKLVVNSASNGVLENADGNLGQSTGGPTFGGPPPPPLGKEYRSFGAALGPAAAATRDLLFGSVGSSDVVTLQATIADNPVLAGFFWTDEGPVGSIVDPEGGLEVGVLEKPGPEARGFSNRNTGLKGGAITPDGWLLSGSRNAGRVTRFDLETLSAVDGVTLQGQKSNVQRLVADASGGRAYAVVMNGHRPRGGADSWLVALDIATLQQGERLFIGRSRNRDLKISPDGRWLAVATGFSNVLIIDLAEFRVRQDVATAAAFGGGAPAPAGAINSVSFSEDGETLYAVTEEGGVLSIDPQQGVVTPLGALTPLGGSDLKVFGTGVADDGRLWVGRNGEVEAFDLGSKTSMTTGYSGQNFAVIGGRPYVAEESSLYRFDADGNEDLSIDLTEELEQHWIGASPF